jgi:hypothetical protein
MVFENLGQKREDEKWLGRAIRAYRTFLEIGMPLLYRKLVVSFPGSEETDIDLAEDALKAFLGDGLIDKFRNMKELDIDVSSVESNPNLAALVVRLLRECVPHLLKLTIDLVDSWDPVGVWRALNHSSERLTRLKVYLEVEDPDVVADLVGEFPVGISKNLELIFVDKLSSKGLNEFVSKIERSNVIKEWSLNHLAGWGLGRMSRFPAALSKLKSLAISSKQLPYFETFRGAVQLDYLDVEIPLDERINATIGVADQSTMWKDISAVRPRYLCITSLCADDLLQPGAEEVLSAVSFLELRDTGFYGVATAEQTEELTTMQRVLRAAKKMKIVLKTVARDTREWEQARYQPRILAPHAEIVDPTTR